MFKKMYLLFIPAIIIFNACFDSGSSNDSDTTFWVPDLTMSYTTDSSAWYKINTDIVKKSDHAIIYLQEGQTVSSGVISQLADEFDNTIYPNVTQYFAEPYDIDGNGKVKIVLFDIEDGYEDSNSYVGGYFYPADFYSQDFIESEGSVVKTNMGDIIYINSNLPSSVDFLNTAKKIIAHEFQHLVNYSEYLTNSNKEDPSDTWIDEGLAESAAHLCYGEMTDRITYLNNYYDDYLSTYGFSLFYWYSDLMNYSLSYLFIQYLRSQSSLNANIYRYIVLSQYGDIRAIKYAISRDSTLSSDSDWSADTEESLTLLLLRFYAANTGKINNTLYQYDSEISTQPEISIQSSSKSSINLYGGAGAVKSLTSACTPANTNNLIYLAVDADGNEDTASPYGPIDGSDTNYLVVVNSDSTTPSTRRTATSLTVESTVTTYQAQSTVQTALDVQDLKVPGKPLYRDPVITLPFDKPSQ